MERQAFPLYKGLQRPLVFKFFRGRFIYWALGSLVAGIISGGIISAVVSSLAGFITLLAVSIPLLMYTVNTQRKGLYSKRKDRYVCMIAPRFKISNHVKKDI
jgi:hypothetical protein